MRIPSNHCPRTLGRYSRGLTIRVGPVGRSDALVVFLRSLALCLRGCRSAQRRETTRGEQKNLPNWGELRITGQPLILLRRSCANGRVLGATLQSCARTAGPLSIAAGVMARAV